jgi:hypothetical protein
MQALTHAHLKMTRRILLSLALVSCAARLRADTFSGGLSPGDFAAAGLSKLTPAELARLDELVQGHQAGAVTKAKEETATQVAAQVRAEEKVAEKRREESFVDRMKVMLKPGTEISYSTLESTIPPPFRGWHKGSVIELSNGQTWAVTDEDDFYGPPTRAPIKATIIPGSMGSFFMVIEGFGKARVKILGNPVSLHAPGGAAAPP